MTMHTINSPLQEILINTGVIQFFSFKYQLFLEVLSHTFTAPKQVGDTCMENTQIERFTDKAISTGLISLNPVFLLILSRQQNYGNMGRFKLILNISAELNAIHLRHHYVRNNQIDLFLLHHIYSFLTVISRVNHIIRTQQFRH